MKLKYELLRHVMYLLSDLQITRSVSPTVQLAVHRRAEPPLSINCHDYYSFCIFHSKIWSYKFPSFVSLVLFPHDSTPPLGCAPKICSFIHLYQNMEIYNYFSIRLTEELIISRINPESLKYKREILSRLSDTNSLTMKLTA